MVIGLRVVQFRGNRARGGDWGWHALRVDVFSRAPLWSLSYFSGSLHFLYMETIFSSLKRTISVRSNSDSPESSSPREKRSKSLAEEDEVLQALNMAGNVSEKLDKILGELKKLEKLDAIEATSKDLTSRLGNVESTIDKMKEDARAVESSIEGMDKSLTYLNKEVEELR